MQTETKYMDKEIINHLPVEYTPDPGQEEVIRIEEGQHVVCGGPGAGKTFLLGLRLRLALTLKHMEPKHAACFTLSRKAASAMRESIARVLPEDKVKDVYVGSLHGKCRRILSEYGVIPENTGVVDDDDSIAMIKSIATDAGFLGPTDEECKLAIDVVHWMHALKKRYPKEIIVKYESFVPKKMMDIMALSSLRYTYQDIVLFYDNIDDFRQKYKYPLELKQTIASLKLAGIWEAYKRENHLIDFGDMLQLAYDYLNSPDCAFEKLKWIQVDESQDLTDFMHMVIRLMATPDAHITYYADVQQAISSFMGTKLETVRNLINACSGHLHRLTRNHRSCRAITKAVNNFARRRLNVEPELMQEQPEGTTAENDEVRLLECQNKERECQSVVEAVKELPENEKLAIIVPNKYEAADVEAALRAAGMTALQMTGEDVFNSQGFRFICAHLSTLVRENDFLSWSRILEGLNIPALPDGGACRRLLIDLRNHMLFPGDLLSGRSYLSRSLDIVAKEYVIFDTETSGLSISTDDIVQLAAVKYRNGVQVDEFSVIMHTDKDLPPMVGGGVNPLIAEYQAGPIVSRREGLEAFLRFIGIAPLFAHNADFDFNILAANLYRDCGITDFYQQHPVCLDTRRIARLALPHQFGYSLKKLIQDLHLKGENTHLATDDVKATAELLNYCMEKYRPIAAAQAEFLKTIDGISRMFRAKYRSFYHQGRLSLFAPPVGDETIMINYMKHLYALFVRVGFITPIDKFGVILDYIDSNIIDREAHPLLNDQISEHLFAISTSREADLCESDTVKERVFIATPYRIKGQQFDRVIVFNANDGKYPHYNNKGDVDKDNEDARKFYVAISRARKKLIITYRKHNTGISRYGEPYDKPAMPSPFIGFLMD